MRRRRGAEAAELQSRADAVAERVLGPGRSSKINEPDVAALVRAELAAERRRQAEAERRAVEARFRGGPCLLCGGTESREVDDAGVVAAGWRPWRDGSVCAWCWWEFVEYARSDTDLVDMVAAVLTREGVEGLQQAHRGGITGIVPGTAERHGVVFWSDSGAPPRRTVRPPAPGRRAHR